VTPVRGRYDASYGQLLHGTGDGRFTAVDMAESGLLIEGQVRHMRQLRAASGDGLIVVARNDTTLQVLHPLRIGGTRGAKPPLVVGARPLIAQPPLATSHAGPASKTLRHR
jgi:hypothetical protein